MRFLLDASLPRSAGDAIRSLGHDAVDVRDIGLGGAPDDVIAERARTDSQVLITRDFAFADIRNYPPAEYPGIIVLDLPNQATAAQVVKALQTFVGTVEWLELLPGRLAIVELTRVRFRPAP